VNILLFVLVIAALLFGKTLIKLMVTRNRVDREIRQTRIEKIHSPGTVTSLTVLPLVDYFTDDPRYKTEAGVSYYLETDGTRILMDLGFNRKKEHPSPLLTNLSLAGKRLEDLDAIFISHAHLDHVGGMAEQKKRLFSVSAGPVELPSIPVYAPVPLAPSDHNPGPQVRVITEPLVIKEGIISIGAIPRALYLLGYTLENALAFRVAGKGLALVIGCGHQTIERVIERAQVLFDDPIYAIIGGLHLPAGGGRMKIGPIDIQPIVGTDRFPWHKINDQDTENAIAAIQKVDPKVIALSPHDSSDRSLARFREVFGDRFQIIKVGTPIVI
jgi:7,8-dihydropterin-6-yl-methyl-4-(beta-D-ribofuranosyl)aminobenzene 5'-phosphate synthase